MEEENSFLSKISRWDDKSRGNWQWERRPSHRNTTIAAVKQRESLDKKIHADLAALKDVETSLSVLTQYVDGDKSEPAVEQVTSPINISDCQRLKAMARQRAHSLHQQSKSTAPAATSTIDTYNDDLVSDLVAKRNVTVEDTTFLTSVAGGDTEDTSPPKPALQKPRPSQPSITSARSLAHSTPNLHLPRQLKLPETAPAPPKVTLNRQQQLELAERQYQWMEDIERKKMRAKMEQLQQETKEIRDAPSIYTAQKSWQIAKKNHAKQTAKQAEKLEIKQKMEDMKKEMRRLRIEEKMLLLQQLEAENNKQNMKSKPVRRRVKKTKKSASALELLPASDSELDNGSLILASDAFQSDNHNDDTFFDLSPDKPTRHYSDNDDESELDIDKISHRSGYSDIQPDESSQQFHQSDDVSPLSNHTVEAKSVSTHSRNVITPPKPRIDDAQSMMRFFDPSSTEDKGRYRVHDARDFDMKSMFRKRDVCHDGVTLLMGKKRSSDEIGVITVLFDRHYFTEYAAKMWWDEHKDRLAPTN